MSNFPVRCPTCSGQKIVRHFSTGNNIACPKCHGRGWLPECDIEAKEEQDMSHGQTHVVVSNAEHQYDWKPKSDITAFELALCMPMFSVDWHQVGGLYDNLPDEAKRHWQIFPDRG